MGRETRLLETPEVSEEKPKLCLLQGRPIHVSNPLPITHPGLVEEDYFGDEGEEPRIPLKERDGKGNDNHLFLHFRSSTGVYKGPLSKETTVDPSG